MRRRVECVSYLHIGDLFAARETDISGKTGVKVTRENFFPTLFY